MRIRRKKNQGFTLIELIMIIVILGILAAVAIPRYYNIASTAETAAEKGVVGGVRAGIHTWWANDNSNPKQYPSTLDSITSGFPVSCDGTNPCFNVILQQGGITSDWSKASATSYTGPTGAAYYYNSTVGSFR